MIGYRCRTLVTMAGPPIEEGAFVVDGPCFQAAGPASSVLRKFPGPVIDLGNLIVLPGLINAHCHLDYTSMRGAILPTKHFPQWIARINALKRTFSDHDYLAATELGFTELRRFGTTSVLNVVATPQIIPQLAPPRLRSWFFLELIDVRPRPWAEEYAFGSWLFFARREGWIGGFGLSPHAPYTVSSALYQLAADCARRFALPVTTHVAESREEYEMFAHGSGELFDLLKQLGRDMQDCGQTSSLRLLLRNRLVPPDTILVHLNELDEADLAELRHWPALSIVHCPKSHRFLQHRPFPLPALRQLGLNICLGTDSLASNNTLNLFSEMRIMRQNFPFLKSMDLLEMTTVNAARSIRLASCLGRITAGFLADAIGIPGPDSSQDVFDAIIDNRSEVPWMMVNGQVLGSP